MKTETYLLRMTKLEKARLNKRAKEMGMTLAAYIRYLGKMEIESSIKIKDDDKNA